MKLASFPRSLALGWLGVSLLVLLAPEVARGAAPLHLRGLRQPARIVSDVQGIPHIYAGNDLDAIFLFGYVHARDRFFQMDLLRRTFSGTSAELLGPPVLPSDVQLRTLGLRRGAEETLAVLPPESRSFLQAYADGVNAYLGSHPLPPEYAGLELTRASVPAWSIVDSLVIGKGLAFGLSFDLSDIDNTIALTAYQQAGAVAGFDGTALFFEDVFRSAPIDPTVSIPRALRSAAGGSAAGSAVAPVPAAAVALAERYRAQAEAVPLLREALHRRDADTGSNWWLVDGAHSTTGHPMLANDPHLSLAAPPVFYEVHLQVYDANRIRPLNANGVSFPGAPAIPQGCNASFCWGSTVNPMDVTDVYLEQLVLDPKTGLPVATLFDGKPETLVLIPQTFRVNQIGDRVPDNLQTAPVGPLEGGVTLVVPRRNNGPIIAVDTSAAPKVTALSVQYTGWRATRELDTFRLLLRGTSLADFKQALQFFDFGSQNWGYADVAGNIAYFTSGEMPVREDLQLLGRPDGAPPYLIRDGAHRAKNEWLPVVHPQPQQALAYEILPFAEMPQVVNPQEGFIANANNDPVGTTLDNNPLNQPRPGGGIFYLSPGYDSLRVGRIRRLLTAALANGGKIAPEDMMRFQGNNQMLDAQLLVPVIEQAFADATRPETPLDLFLLTSDPRVADAGARLAAWDWSTPTGIPQGYDPGDDPAALPPPGDAEVRASVAATLYSVWRSRAIANILDGTLAKYGVGAFHPDSRISVATLGHLLLDFPEHHGIGASGIDFFTAAGAQPSREAARDVVVLKSLKEALDLLASDAFAPAFHGSTDLDDDRWGFLHRIVFRHPLGGPFSIPEGGGFHSLAPDLPGLAVSGGFETVDAASHDVRASGVDDFMFGSGPARRFVGVLSRPIEAWQILPGGEGSAPGSPHQADQLGRWLTVGYHRLLLRPEDVQANGVSQQVFLPVE
jgi:penicillin G amidase